MTKAVQDGAFSHEDPIGWFEHAFAKAKLTESFDPSRAALASVDADGAPAVRFVLVKGAGQDGFVFYTNHNSPKARQLDADPRAALCFHWESTSTQVRITGAVQRVSAPTSDAYFRSRPRESQLGAWASAQSEGIADRAALEGSYVEAERRFPSEVPRPTHWGGYVLQPTTMEFWVNREGRMHDRWHFVREGQGWRMTRLQP